MAKNTIKVYFDGVCSHCSKEINYYKEIAQNGLFEWIDVTANPKAMIEYNITQAEALLFIHAIDHNNTVFVGSEAFALIWKNLPNWKFLGHIVSLPIIRILAKHLYIQFAKRRFKRYRHCQLASKTLID